MTHNTNYLNGLEQRTRTHVGSSALFRRSATSKWDSSNVLSAVLLATFSIASGLVSAQDQGSGSRLLNIEQAPPAAPESASSGSVPARAWRLEPYVDILETLTDNVNLAPSGSKKADMVSQITPGIRIHGKGARTSLDGFIASPIVLYARSDSGNNNVYPSANIVGNIEAIERFFYVDASVSSSQQSFSPFGAQAGNLTSVTENRYTTTSYGVSPYIKGTARGNLDYVLRNNNTWTNISDAPVDTDNSYLNQWLGSISSPVAPLGWGVDFDRKEIRFKNRDSELTQIARARIEYKIFPQLQTTVSGGYEDNQYSTADYKGAIYGVGVQWRPTQRTSLLGNWEHRFFGSSYSFALDHRTPLSVWNVRVSRNITSYPEQTVSLPAGGNVQGLLNEAYSSRIADPTQRQAAVDQFIRDRGLPAVLSNPVNIYTQQITLQEYQSATFGLLATRNTIFFTVFNSKTTAVLGSGVPLGLSSSTDNTQRGGSITWSHRLTPLVNLNATAATTRTFPNDDPTDKATQSDFRLTISSPLTARTSVYGGAWYQAFRSDVTSDYNAAAVFVGLNHIFR